MERRPKARRANVLPARTSRRTSQGASRPVLLRVSQDMKHWAAMLGGELETWPGVSTKPMFGFLSFYRGQNIFAALPKTRSMGSPNSFIFRLPQDSPLKARAKRDARIGSSEMASARWLTFEMQSQADLRDALTWLDRAYLAAGKPRLTKRAASPRISNVRSRYPLPTAASPRLDTALPADRRFDRRLAEILAHATEVFCEKGYEGASMRDLSRATGTSLAGLYYYFESKEKLLYLIQKHTFSTILERLQERLEGVRDPEQRVRVLVENHLDYFLANAAAMKVLSHEADVLKNTYGAQIAAIKRQYYRTAMGLLEDLKRSKGLEFNARIAVLSLFGMMNWIYTWYNPRVDADAEALARQMGDLFLRGILGSTRGKRNGRR